MSFPKLLTPNIQGYPLALNDRLRSTMQGPTLPQTVRIVAKVLREDGQVHVHQFDHIKQGTADEQSQTFDLGPGILIALTATLQNGSAVLGDLFYQCAIVPESAFDANKAALLIKGYITQQEPLAWPWTEHRDANQSTGRIATATFSNPSAGSDISQSVPGTAHRIINAISFTLTTDANAANRFVALQILDSSDLIFSIRSQNAVPASTTQIFSFLKGGQPEYKQTEIHIPLPPDLRLPQNFTIQTDTENIQVGDQFSALVIFAQDFYILPS